MDAGLGLRLALLAVAALWRWGGAAAAAPEVYTNTWAVRIAGGDGEADRVARKHGFINHGNVGPTTL
ncbi:hypothetical protein NHX12_003369 [Muraenolepis orangiensis]|uniref:Peptidase S8 pro-domain domain-containing protein n=1 Tax=Muraenolepis orangiensis TaxID=630683 RepID=A0A9Q0DYW3_9TELE|nr:hypothetical protein NHX12_003369 [Muraenolepis orangiensis]